MVSADGQTRGRGRLDRTWESPPGTCLAASFVVQPRSLLSLLTGVAAAEACGEPVRLKWPNDLLLEGRKVGGILVEAKPERAVIGVGVNLTWAPPGGASLGIDRETLLRLLCDRLGDWLQARDEDVLSRWRELSATLGQPVRLEVGGEVISGIAEDIAPDGALILAGRHFSAGDVTHVRPGAGPGEPQPPVPG